MPDYTVLFAHLADTKLNVGDTIKRGQPIGIQGNTGYSYGEHAHVGVVDGIVKVPWWLSEALEKGGRYNANKTQTDFFVANDLYYPTSKNPDGRDQITITTPWGGYKDHYAYDLIRKKSDGKSPILYYNRSYPGKVEAVVNYGDKRYGLCVLISYNTDEKETPKGKIGTITTDGVRLRDKPDLINGKTIKQLSAGDKVAIVDTVKDQFAVPWYKTSDGHYVHFYFVRFL